MAKGIQRQIDRFLGCKRLAVVGVSGHARDFTRICSPNCGGAATIWWRFGHQADGGVRGNRARSYITGPYILNEQVGLWAASLDTGYAIGTLLATVTFSAATPGTANGFYHSLAISPLDLSPGAYEVGVFLETGSDPYLTYSVKAGCFYWGQTG